MRAVAFLGHRNLVSITNALATSRLDYCNLLYTGLPLEMIWKLQLMQNAVAQVLRGSSKVKHITPILQDLHWLPIGFRVQFKVVFLTLKPFKVWGQSL